MKRLDIGCGQTKADGDIGMDIFAGPKVDVVHSFDDFPYPFHDGEFNEVKCMSSLEHVADVIGTMREIHRVLKPGGIVKIWVPHYSGPDAYRDFTHKTFFSYLTMDRFAEGVSYGTADSGLFRMLRKSLGLPDEGGSKLKAIPKWLANRYPDKYETFFCWMVPTKTIYYEMQALK